VQRASESAGAAPFGGTPSAVSNLETPAPEVSSAEAIRAAAELFGLNVAAAERLPGERDRNFLLTTTDDIRLVMKVVHPQEEPAVSQFQARLLHHLGGRGLPVQAVVPPRNGCEPVLSPVAAPNIRCRVRCVTYLPGRPLAEVSHSPGRSHQLGRFLAQLDLALSDFRDPLAGRPFLWDSSRAEQLRPLTGHVRDSQRRAQVTEILDVFEAEVSPRLPALRSQVIHNDANPHNVLVDGQADGISGLIDFGDAVRAPLVQELAVAIAYQRLAGPAPFRAALDVTGGYHEVLELTADELALIPALVATRLALTSVITGWRSALHPENAAYILRNDRTIAANLALIPALTTADGTRRFVRRVLDGASDPELSR
jgi:hydroxylysine kinase